MYSVYMWQTVQHQTHRLAAGRWREYNQTGLFWFHLVQGCSCRYVVDERQWGEMVVCVVEDGCLQHRLAWREHYQIRPNHLEGFYCGPWNEWGGEGGDGWEDGRQLEGLGRQIVDVVVAGVRLSADHVKRWWLSWPVECWGTQAKVYCHPSEVVGASRCFSQKTKTCSG